MNIITTHKKYLIFRCAERGYSIEEVMPCVINQDGDMWTIDTEHKAYPSQSKINIQRGVGSELKKLLKIIGIHPSEECTCNERARLMDANGIEWCEENKKLILSWLEEEANKRQLLFSELGASILLNLAIRRAKNLL